jgi:hypothetical protein
MNVVQNEFFRNTVPAAQSSQWGFLVPASIALAQATIESGWGKSGLATKYNNYFVIKPDDHAAPDIYVEMLTTEFMGGVEEHLLQPFMKYASPAECFVAHARLLALAPRYKSAMACCDDAERCISLYGFGLHLCEKCSNRSFGSSLPKLTYLVRLLVPACAFASSHAFVPGEACYLVTSFLLS